MPPPGVERDQRALAPRPLDHAKSVHRIRHYGLWATLAANKISRKRADCPTWLPSPNATVKDPTSDDGRLLHSRVPVSVAA